MLAGGGCGRGVEGPSLAAARVGAAGECALLKDTQGTRSVYGFRKGLGFCFGGSSGEDIGFPEVNQVLPPACDYWVGGGWARGLSEPMALGEGPS